MSFDSLALSAHCSTAPQPAEQPAPPPRGSGCSAEISLYRAVRDNDRATGVISPTVHAVIQSEIAEAERACASGDPARASELLRASMKRHGCLLN
jgi:hypothetical protein